MKKIKNISFIAMSIVFLGLWSCSKDQLIEKTANETVSRATDLVKVSAIDASDGIDELSRIEEANQARLDAKGQFQLKS